MSCWAMGLCPFSLIWQSWALRNMLGCLFPQHGMELMSLSSLCIRGVTIDCHKAWKPLRKWVMAWLSLKSDNALWNLQNSSISIPLGWSSCRRSWYDAYTCGDSLWGRDKVPMPFSGQFGSKHAAKAWMTISGCILFSSLSLSKGLVALQMAPEEGAGLWVYTLVQHWRSVVL